MSQITAKKINLELCENPIPICYAEVPDYDREDYDERIEKLLKAATQRGYSHVVIYGDREHWSNICYFTGFDPRFEEALLIFEIGKKPRLVVGNEGMAYSWVIPVEVERVLYQNFGLMGQPNEDSQPLLNLFLDSGISLTSRVGVIGWKHYSDAGFSLGHSILDVPSYLVETLAQACKRSSLENATDLLSDNESGLKHSLSAKEIVHFELQGTRASRMTYQVLKNLREGMTEIEASQFLGMDGEPTCTHPNINFGTFNVGLGLRSPTYHQTLHLGDPVGAGVGYRGSLVHKCALYIRGESDLPDSKGHYMEKFMKPYYDCLASWYEAIRIGTVYGDLYQLVDSMLGLKKFGIGLNPGHLTHTDEWTNSPFRPGNMTKIHSGTGIQCDFTAVFKDPFLAAHVEDGLVVADSALRKQIRSISPSCWKRIEARQAFMRDVLHICIADEVLPLSDMPGVCFPYMADLTVILCKN